MQPFELTCANRNNLTRDWTFGAAGDGPGEFRYPNDLLFHDGHLYVADTMNRRIQVFTTDGAFVRQWAVVCPLEWSYFPFYLAVHRGHLVVCCVRQTGKQRPEAWNLRRFNFTERIVDVDGEYGQYSEWRSDQSFRTAFLIYTFDGTLVQTSPEYNVGLPVGIKGQGDDLFLLQRYCFKASEIRNHSLYRPDEYLWTKGHWYDALWHLTSDDQYRVQIGAPAYIFDYAWEQDAVCYFAPYHDGWYHQNMNHLYLFESSPALLVDYASWGYGTRTPMAVGDDEVYAFSDRWQAFWYGWITETPWLVAYPRDYAILRGQSIPMANRRTLEWQLFGNERPLPMAMACDPETRMVYILSWDGFWEYVPPKSDRRKLVSTFYDTYTGILYCAYVWNDTLYVRTRPSGGAWTDPVGAVHGGYNPSIRKMPNGEVRIWCMYGALEQGVYVSDDDGETWRRDG